MPEASVKTQSQETMKLLPSGSGSNNGSSEKQTGSTSEPRKPVIAEPPLPPTRPAKPHWIKQILFAIVYHLGLWLVFALLTAPGFYWLATRGDARTPTYYGYGSFIGDRPKLNSIPDTGPLGSGHRNEIEFDPAKPTSFESHTKHLESTLKSYSEMFETGLRCDHRAVFAENSDQSEAVCAVDVTDRDPLYGFGECAMTPGNHLDGQRKFGYDEGSPCLMLRFNRILDYVPDGRKANSTPLLEAMCHGEEDCCHRYRVPIKCWSPDSKEVRFEVFPKEGVSSCVWPYRGQPNYTNPAAMLRVSELPFDKSVLVVCAGDTEHLYAEDPYVHHHILRFWLKRQQKAL